MLRTSRNDHDVAWAADPLFAAEAHFALEHDVPKFGGGRTTSSTSDVMIIGGTSVNGKKVFVLPLSSFAPAVGALEEVSDLFLYIRGGGADIDGGVRWGVASLRLHRCQVCRSALLCEDIGSALKGGVKSPGNLVRAGGGLTFDLDPCSPGAGHCSISQNVTAVK